MKIPKSINRIRVSVTHLLTGGIGRKQTNEDAMKLLNERSTIKRILVSRPNGRLGNQLLITPLVQELESTFPQSKIDLFVKGGISSVVFENYNSIGNIISLPRKPFANLFKYFMAWVKLKKHKYDLVINAVEASSSGRLSTQIVKARFRFYNTFVPGLDERYPDYSHTAKYPVYNFRNLFTDGSTCNIGQEMPTLNIKLSDNELEKGKNLVRTISKTNKQVISIYTFATGDKCYPKAWWNALYNRLLTEFGENYTIVEVLPIENVSQIEFAAPSYYSKDIREMASFIANTEIFITADCGIMHLAASTDTPVVGFFSVTSSDCYRPYGNSSMAIDTNQSGHEDIIARVKDILQSNDNPQHITKALQIKPEPAHYC